MPSGLASLVRCLGFAAMLSAYSAAVAAGYELVKNMLAVPVTKESVAPLVLAAVAATQMPFAEIVGAVRGLLLF